MNNNQNNRLTLYPSGWLYNAGVIGFLISLYEIEHYNINDLFEKNTVVFNDDVFQNLLVEDRYFIKNPLCKCYIVGNIPRSKFTKYLNYIHPSRLKQDKSGFSDFVKSLPLLEKNPNDYCFLCNTNYNFPDETINDLNEKWETYGNSTKFGFTEFINRITNFSNSHTELLGAAPTSFSNAFWNLDISNRICPLCSFLIIHHHLALTELSDKSKIFINASSFKLMYELNKLVRAMFETGSEQLKIKEILAISLIEYSRKLSVSLGMWQLMNIEVVVQKKDNIDYLTLPYNVMRIISDRKIANLLSEIGEIKVLQLILEERFSELTDLSYKILRTSLKNKKEISSYDRDLISDIIKLDRNKYNPTELANKILFLYSLIEEKLKGVEV